jgi:acetyl esterase
MALDPQVKAYLDQLAAANVLDVPAISVREARAQMEVGAVMLGRPPKVGRIEDQTFPGLAGPVRLRVTAPAGPGPFPALVFFHGGGFVVGSLSSHDHLCRAITNAAGIAVVSVDYRLAPEHPFPAAPDDAYAAVAWLADRAHGEALGIDATRLAVGGDSAGGNLSAVVARRARDRGGPRLLLQLLIYPVTDADLDTPSYRENADGYLLSRAAMQWYWEQYVPQADRRADPDAAPLRAADLSGLPPALVVTAEHDVLRDEGEAYARKLADAGVPTRLRRYPGMIHGFLRRHTLFDQGRIALSDVAEALRSGLGLDVPR